MLHFNAGSKNYVAAPDECDLEEIVCFLDLISKSIERLTSEENGAFESIKKKLDEVEEMDMESAFNLRWGLLDVHMYLCSAIEEFRKIRKAMDY